VSGDDSDDDPAATQRAMDAELLDENGKPKSLSKEEMRRVRRMISNRESARRSRRRKLEHVQCLDGQVSARGSRVRRESELCGPCMRDVKESTPVCTCTFFRPSSRANEPPGARQARAK
jgi:hypothetical protein